MNFIRVKNRNLGHLGFDVFSLNICWKSF